MMKRPRLNKTVKNVDRLYKEGQCRDCTVVVTRMDFAKILGKFTKVKIQYESNTTPKEKQKAIRELPSSSNSRLKNNENGMVLIHRSAYKEHPVKEVVDSKKRSNIVKSPFASGLKRPLNNNILKENNRLKKSPDAKVKDVKTYSKRLSKTSLKQYGIVFKTPKPINSCITKNLISLLDLLPSIDKTLLPSEDWSIDYLPNTDEPKEDKVYDKIAAELENLMYNEKSNIIQPADGKTKDSESKGVDDFPSILDILNENTSDASKTKKIEQNKSPNTKLANSDVEAMLLGQPDTSQPLDASDSSITNLIDVDLTDKPVADHIDEPCSPSILDEALQKGIAEHLSDKVDQDERKNKAVKENCINTVEPMETDQEKSTSDTKIEIDMKGPAKEITHLVFKLMKNGSCKKSVTCPKNLKYNIEFAGKTAELLGAPTFISSREDLQVLLQIVNESELESFYVYTDK